MNEFKTYFTDLFSGIRSLLTGMKVTTYYFIHPKEIVTQQYPENRKTLKMFDNFKGEVVMIHSPENQHTCTACGICSNNCPNNTIQVLSSTTEIEGKKKKVLDKYMYNLGSCTFCGLCVKTCPSKSLAFGQKFEHAVYDRSQLLKQLNQANSSYNKEIKV